jgi:hypothetical protein
MRNLATQVDWIEFLIFISPRAGHRSPGGAFTNSERGLQARPVRLSRTFSELRAKALAQDMEAPQGLARTQQGL